MQRPLLLLDVDGVLSLFGFDPAAAPAGRFVSVDGIPHLLSLEAAALSALMRDYELVWCTGWEERADEHLPFVLGLPAGAPHLRFGDAHRSPAATGSSTRSRPMPGPLRPLAWIDDGHDEGCRAWAAGSARAHPADRDRSRARAHRDRPRSAARRGPRSASGGCPGSAEVAVPAGTTPEALQPRPHLGERPLSVDEFAGQRRLLREAVLLQHGQAVLRRHVCGKAARDRPSATAAGRLSPLGTTRLTSPIRSASVASTGRPVKIRSIARLVPIRRGRRTVPPSIRGTPQRRQNTPNTASCSATRRSHQRANSRPPATA